MDSKSTIQFEHFHSTSSAAMGIVYTIRYLGFRLLLLTVFWGICAFPLKQPFPFPSFDITFSRRGSKVQNQAIVACHSTPGLSQHAFASLA